MITGWEYILCVFDVLYIMLQYIALYPAVFACHTRGNRSLNRAQRIIAVLINNTKRLPLLGYLLAHGKTCISVYAFHDQQSHHDHDDHLGRCVLAVCHRQITYQNLPKRKPREIIRSQQQLPLSMPSRDYSGFTPLSSG